MLDVDWTSMASEALDDVLEHLRGNGDTEPFMPCPDLVQLLEDAIAREASDVHLCPGYPPTFRVHGRLQSFIGDEALTSDETRRMVETLLPERSRSAMDASKNLDCSVSLPYRGGNHRFRASVYLAEAVAACLRHIPSQIPTLEWPSAFPRNSPHASRRTVSAFVVITGVVGSGKTATLAALVNPPPPGHWPPDPHR